MTNYKNIVLDHVALSIYQALNEYRQKREPAKSNAAEIDSAACSAFNFNAKGGERWIWSDGLADSEQSNADRDIYQGGKGKLELEIGEKNARDEHRHYGETVDQFGISTDDVSPPSPKTIAAVFAREAASKLSASEVRMLLDFLQMPSNASPMELNSLVDQKLEIFWKAEIEEFGQPRNRLARPSDIGEFWDKESKMIQILAEKGFRPEFVYCFDWRFRADDNASRDNNGRCFAKRWPIAQHELHTQLADSLLSLLPLEWLIVGGSCPQKGYRKTLRQFRILFVPISPGTSLEFDVDLTPNKLRRITTYIKHPAASLYSRHQITSFAGAQDSALNFYLWLVNKDFNPTFISTMGSHKIFSADIYLQELWAYRQMEQRSGMVLKIDAYQPSFLEWATKYLEERPEDVLARGESLPSVITAKFGEGVSRRSAARYQAKDFWDGEEVLVTKKGAGASKIDAELGRV